MPSSGTYTVLVYPYSHHVTTFTGQVLVTQDVTATLATNGTPTVINLTQPGQQARASLTGVAGQDWTLDLSGLTLSTSGEWVRSQVLRSDGSSVVSGSCYTHGGGCSTIWLGMTAGTHTVVLTPYPNGVTGSVTLKSVGLESGHGSADTRHRSHLYEHGARPSRAAHLHWHRGAAARAGAVELYDFGKRRHAKCGGAQARWHAADEHRIYSGQYNTYCCWNGPAGAAHQWYLHGARVSVSEACHHLQWPGVGHLGSDGDAGYQWHADGDQSGAAGATGAGDVYWSSRTGLGTGSFGTDAVHRWAVCLVPKCCVRMG